MVVVYFYLSYYIFGEENYRSKEKPKYGHYFVAGIYNCSYFLKYCRIRWDLAE